MNVHEYQSKQILASFGVKVPMGFPAFTAEEAVAAAEELNAPVTVVKAQIHAGGRGKAGGVKVVKGLDAVREAAQELLGKTLVTKQTGPQGKVVHRLLIEAGASIEKEYYLSFVLDRKLGRVVMIGSASGGMEIEQVAKINPQAIVKEVIDPAVGLLPFQCTRMAFALHLAPKSIKAAKKLMNGLYRAFCAKDCTLAEINPMVVTTDGDVMALDAKLNFDDSALFRHPELEKLRDAGEEDAKEREAAKAGLNYVSLGGDVACMVNGAGLAMATVDMIKYYGGEPANFLDVGGDSTPEKIATAFRIMLEGGQAQGIFVNIFGGINKCDVVAEGIVKAAQEVAGGNAMPVPVVVRLEGTNVERGREILTHAGVGNLYMAKTMEGGAEQIVSMVKKTNEVCEEQIA
ncbi:MAG: ADP-forming succinate--CoA ligase subunit beta [Selenomonadaceae bacterium]|nr:ADP-forming succinate--CoA ligase subunit beta [Selenomonadaceae bacterium]MDY2684561.1 ADP-forming succinate--CoA ligase subunit beta [Selenomonadaceae bacterium]